MPSIPTIKVHRTPDVPPPAFCIINEVDFDPAVHTRVEDYDARRQEREEREATERLEAEMRLAAERLAAERLAAPAGEPVAAPTAPEQPQTTPEAAPAPETPAQGEPAPALAAPAELTQQQPASPARTTTRGTRGGR